jgi:hypothetical protein
MYAPLSCLLQEIDRSAKAERNGYAAWVGFAAVALPCRYLGLFEIPGLSSLALAAQSDLISTVAEVSDGLV